MSAATFVALSLALAGCGRGGSTAASTPSGEQAPAKVAVVLKTAANSYWQNVQTGAQAGAQQAGADATIQAAKSDSDIAGQTSLTANLAGGAFKCVAVAPITATNLVQPLSSLAQAGATVVNIDSAIDPTAASAAGVKIATFIASNSESAGQMAGKQMAQLLGGTGKVAVVGGLAGDANSAARTKGFTDAVQGAGLTVVQTVAADWDREKALNAADAILRSTPDLGGFYAANDTMALGIVQAAQNAGNKTVKIIGTDGDKDAIEAVAAGQLAATVSQYPYVIGLEGVEACVAAVRGKQLPAKVDSPLALITPDNSTKALSSFPKPIDAYDDPFTALLKG